MSAWMNHSMRTSKPEHSLRIPHALAAPLSLALTTPPVATRGLRSTPIGRGGFGMAANGGGLSRCRQVEIPLCNSRRSELSLSVTARHTDQPLMVRLSFLRAPRPLMMLAALCSYLSACSAPSTHYSTPGTLFVKYAPSTAQPTGTTSEAFTEFRDGRSVGRRPSDILVARNRTNFAMRASSLHICSARNAPGIYTLSPDGTKALCKPSNDGHLYVFNPLHPDKPRTLDDFPKGSAISIAWLDNSRFAATIYDKTCPLANLYGYSPTRIGIFYRTGRRISTGPCAFGIVAGQHRVAIMREARNGLLWKGRQLIADDPNYYNDGYDSYHHTWSVDGGVTWHDGTLIAFDGNDQLLYFNGFARDVLSENGQIALQNVLDIKWSPWRAVSVSQVLW